MWLRVWCGILIGILLFAGEAVAFTGNEYRGLPEGVRMFYVIGVLDGFGETDAFIKAWRQKDPTLQIDPIMWEGLIGNIVRCTVGKMPFGQLRAIVDKYVADHPAEWHKEMSMLVWSAMQAACPNTVIPDFFKGK